MTGGRTERRVGLWLAVWAVMVLFTVVIGGVTRLTNSGLSITEWRPVSGVVPPLSAAAWEAEFAKYQAIPEYRIENPDLTLAGFKRIYLVEFVHRFWARLVGLVLAVPLLLGLARGWFTPRVRNRLVGIVLLTGLQGAMGWYMVKSGLSVRTDVSQYRLAAHLLLALVVFAMALWTAADLLGRPQAPAVAPGLRRHALATVALVLVTAVAGAFVAGLHAGKVYNEFPLMAGRFVPEGYLAQRPWYRNFFENVATVQFDHRLLAELTAVVVIALAVRLWRAAPAGAGRSLALLIGLAVGAQFALGLLTLLWSVPIPVAAFHQAGAVVLFGLSLLVAHRVTRSTAPVRSRRPGGGGEPARPAPGA